MNRWAFQLGTVFLGAAALIAAGCDESAGVDGISCWDTNANGECDGAEDVDGSGSCDAKDCAGPAGEPGLPGEKGDKGDKGDQGDKGETGLQGETGPAGLDGLPGVDGTDGADGAAGPPGADGAAGPPGPAGPAGPTLMKRTTFLFASVPAASTPGQLSTITFTPPTSGTALVSARGYCNMTAFAGSDNEINIALGTTLANAFSTPVSEWGVVNVPSGSPSGLYQEAWTAERAISVTAGTAYTYLLSGRHEIGSGTSDCSGSLRVEVFTDTLP